jgi:ribonuclease M5
MITLDRPVIVEGKYDKQKLSAVLDTTIITTNGFRIFNDREKRALIRRLAEKNGIFVLTDADGAGLVIRNLLRGCVPKDKITNLYIPAVMGKERRKAAPSKEGYLGVEGMDAELLASILAPYAIDAKTPMAKGSVTKTDLYEMGLSGGAASAQKRERIAKALSLPPHMSANALLEAINLLYTKEEFLSACKECEIDIEAL